METGDVGRRRGSWKQGVKKVSGWVAVGFLSIVVYMLRGEKRYLSITVCIWREEVREGVITGKGA